jgi:hypothetical protein
MEGDLKRSFVDTDGETRWYNEKSKTVFMPYNLDEEDYGKLVRGLIEEYGYVVQLEIV